VAAGASWWDRNATHEIRSAVVNRELLPARERKISLTAREKEILTLMVAGKIDRDIAETLYIAPATVRVHIHGILHKIGAADRSTAISIAQQEHLLDDR
jgi:two-component system NarL family response regulator